MGVYYDDDLMNLIADKDRAEMQEIADDEQNDADAEQDYMDQLAEARWAEQNNSPAGYEQDLSCGSDEGAREDHIL